MPRVRSLGINEDRLPEDRSSSIGVGALIVLRIADSSISQNCCAVVGGRVARTQYIGTSEL